MIHYLYLMVRDSSASYWWGDTEKTVLAHFAKGYMNYVSRFVKRSSKNKTYLFFNLAIPLKDFLLYK